MCDFAIFDCFEKNQKKNLYRYNYTCMTSQYIARSTDLAHIAKVFQTQSNTVSKAPKDKRACMQLLSIIYQMGGGVRQEIVACAHDHMDALVEA